jgi:broad specificity phosphatase PhoE
MSELFLVRHAQASFDAENYDQLSELGFQQAGWLGEHFRERGIQFDQIFTGTMLRQKQTAHAILESLGTISPLQTLAGLDEFDFHRLGAVYCRLTGSRLPERSEGKRPFFQMLRLAMRAWADDSLHITDADTAFELSETWEQFHARVAAAALQIQESCEGKRVLAVSSGGPISALLSQVLGCDVDTLISLNMQIKNTGITHLYFRSDALILSSFNNAAHIERPDRAHALTYA